jgi:hypothetical protein
METVMSWGAKPVIKFERKKFMVVENKKKSLAKDVCPLGYNSDKTRGLLVAGGYPSFYL